MADNSATGDARRRQFLELMNWIYENGGMHCTTSMLSENVTLETFTFAGAVLLIKAVTHRGTVSYEFFMPVSSDSTWDGTRAALARKLARRVAPDSAPAHPAAGAGDRAIARRARRDTYED